MILISTNFLANWQTAETADPNKYKLSGKGIEFDASEILLLSDDSGFSKHVIIFGGNMSSFI